MRRQLTMELRICEVDKGGEGKKKHRHRRTRKNTEKTEAETRNEEHIIQTLKQYSSVGAKSKGSNGGVAVGLPHRNYSVFKQAHIN